MKLSPLIDECAIQEKKIPSKSIGLMNHEMLHSVQYNYLEFLKKPNNV